MHVSKVAQQIERGTGCLEFATALDGWKLRASPLGALE